MTDDTPAMLFDGPADAAQVLLLAHGAGAPMDSPFMDGIVQRLAARNCRVARFEFSYMAARREGDKRPPPNREPKLREAFWQAIAACRTVHPKAALFIGGKSMGGRIASMIADEGADQGQPLAGVICLGYPFRPPGNPDKLRVAHLQTQQTPTLIVHGTRDPFGKPDEVAGYGLAPAVQVHWIESGNHDLKPLKSSGRSGEDCWDEAAETAIAFMNRIVSASS